MKEKEVPQEDNSIYKSEKRAVYATGKDGEHGVVASSGWDVEEEETQQAGAEVIDVPVAPHDEGLAATSHLPHMLAFTLVDTLARLEDHDDIFRYAAGGFRDFTRIAASDPTMWRDIALTNREALIAMMGQFETFFAELKEDVAVGSGERLFEFFRRSKQSRDEII